MEFSLKIGFVVIVTSVLEMVQSWVRTEIIGDQNRHL